jgi:hypothetical protein
MKNNYRRFKLGELSCTAYIARNKVADKAEAYRDGKLSDCEYKKAIEDYCRLRLQLVKKRTGKVVQRKCMEKMLEHLPGLSQT